MKKKIAVTIVGKGSYGKLIARKYIENPAVRVRAFVAPRPKKVEGKLAHITTVRTAGAWKNKFGFPRKHDVFDLCIHQPILLQTLQEFVAIGARNFILPKPVAVDKKGLDALQQFIKVNDLKVVVASQWYYSHLVKELAEITRDLGKEKVHRIKVSFSHSFEGKRGQHYTPVTASLPHVLQILYSAGLSQLNATNLRIDSSSPEKLTLHSARARQKPETVINIDILSNSRAKTVEIFTHRSGKPKITAEFGGIFETGRFLEYPSITLDGKITPIVEDVLETMVLNVVEAFGGDRFEDGKNIATFKNYLPVAKKVAEIAGKTERPIAIIGGGIFGTLIGLQIATRGQPVTIFEKSNDILLGASLVNQCRVHMGYHYPRDKETAEPLFSAKDEFCKLFPDAVVNRGFSNYYCVAKSGTLTTKENYLSFCKDMKLPFKEELPRGIRLKADKIALSLRVPEPILDVRHLRRHLHSLIENQKYINLITRAEVTDIKSENGIFHVSFSRLNEKHNLTFGAVINATYSSINILDDRAAIPLKTYQYELCEIPVVSTPWRRPTGIAIMDGPFFGVMPFGFSREYLLYDVEISVLERVVSEFPRFRHDVTYYDDRKTRAERFKKYIRKMRLIIPEVTSCKHLYSLYAVRIVLPHKEKTDTRPTIVENPVPGYWHIFSGKIATSALFSKTLARDIEAFLEN